MKKLIIDLYKINKDKIFVSRFGIECKNKPGVGILYIVPLRVACKKKCPGYECNDKNPAKTHSVVLIMNAKMGKII